MSLLLAPLDDDIGLSGRQPRHARNAWASFAAEVCRRGSLRPINAPRKEALPHV